MRIWLMWILIAGCGKPDCASAVNGAVDRMVADARARKMPGAATLARIQSEMKHVVTAACLDDQWPQAVIDCVDHAHDKQALDACDRQLTPEQHEHERTRLDDVLRLAVQPIVPAGSAQPR